jgi:hypothetical protein
MAELEGWLGLARSAMRVGCYDSPRQSSLCSNASATRYTCRPYLHSRFAEIIWKHARSIRYRLYGFRGFVTQIGLRVSSPFPQTHLAYRFRDRYTKSSVAIEDGDADLDGLGACDGYAGFNRCPAGVA